MQTNSLSQIPVWCVTVVEAGLTTLGSAAPASETTANTKTTPSPWTIRPRRATCGCQSAIRAS